MAFYDVLVHVALIIWILIGGAVLVGSAVLLPRLLGALSQLDRLTLVVTDQILPMAERFDAVGDRLGVLADAAIVQVDQVDRTVARATDSVERMIDVAEERIAEINALLTVAIEEAEETFYSTAGVLRALRGGRRGRRRRFGIPRRDGRRRRIG
ncbi:MAG: hypothetical protein RRA92_00280 [Gemmatimonadota bacterium]|nr:hypothetical protein [Gemmatimonadota bacterium]